LKIIRIILVFGFFCTAFNQNANACGIPPASVRDISKSIVKGVETVVCEGGTESITSVPLNDLKTAGHLGFMVFADGFMDFASVITSVKAKGFRPRLIFNGGYFQTGGSKIYSYYKTAVGGKEFEQSSLAGPRSCMVFQPDSPEKMSVFLDHDENYNWFKNIKNGEIYCVGPGVVSGGGDVSMKQFCDEHFDPKCRPKGDDPGINFMGNYPRIGSCVTRDGQFKVFSYSSEVKKCGISGPNMAKRMIEENCLEGVNHDGGGSVKLYHLDRDGKLIQNFGADPTRKIPVWGVVYEK
jgi:hypothetical protein